MESLPQAVRGFVAAACHSLPADWQPRLTLALRVYDWRQWGVTDPPRYEPE